MQLTSEQVDKFEQDGYLILPEIISPSKCDILREEAKKLALSEESSDNPDDAFETRTNKQAQSDFFLESYDKIRLFYEKIENNGDTAIEEHNWINKIGHALHQLNPVFKSFNEFSGIKSISTSLGMKEPTIVQSMYIFKSPRVGGEVSPHRDSTYLHADPQSVMGIWTAIDDATQENGCLWFAPGSHKLADSYKMIRTTENGENTTIFEGEGYNTDSLNFVPAEVKKGSVILIHGKVFHMSYKNESDAPRNAYTVHLYDKGISLWEDSNWIRKSTPSSFVSL